MILRAIVAVAVVAVLAPRVPHANSEPGPCPKDARACSAGAEFIQRVRDSGVQSLVEVRSQIEADEQARSQQHRE